MIDRGNNNNFIGLVQFLDFPNFVQQKTAAEQNDESAGDAHQAQNWILEKKILRKNNVYMNNDDIFVCQGIVKRKNNFY